MASIKAIERALRQEKIQMQQNPKTFLDLVAPTPAAKREFFTKEEREAYKARQTAKALEHCRRQREYIVQWQAYNGFY